MPRLETKNIFPSFQTESELKSWRDAYEKQFGGRMPINKFVRFLDPDRWGYIWVATFNIGSGTDYFDLFVFHTQAHVQNRPGRIQCVGALSGKISGLMVVNYDAYYKTLRVFREAQSDSPERTLFTMSFAPEFA